MGDDSETIFNHELFLRDCTCPKPECSELEIEIISLGGARAKTRVSADQLKDLRWFLDQKIARHAHRAPNSSRVNDGKPAGA
jgi:hypothetical protein